MEYGSQIAFALILSIPVACITWTITQEEIFHEMRERLAGYQARHRHSWWRRKPAQLITCPYCTSHYVAGALIGLLRFRMLVEDWRGYVISLFTLVLLANVYITFYHLLRVGLRWSRSLADRAERPARAIPKQALSNSAAAASMDLTERVPARRRSVRSVPSDRWT
jgi:hypothetical protein